MSFLSQLQLYRFRCYGQARLDNLPPGLIVLTGPNGAGKTNVLEGISMLSPGRGLRGARLEDIQSMHESAPWAVSAVVGSSSGFIQIGTGIDPAKDKRVVHIQGVPSKSQSALADHLSVIWLTPQMDRLFLDGAGARRKFFDRLVFAFDPGHAGRVTRYENALGQRSRLLKEGGADPLWLRSLEAQMAETGVAIAAARLDFLQRLQLACDHSFGNPFPRAHLQMTGTVEELLAAGSALQVEEMLAYQLSESRLRDAETGGAASGPHKSDLQVRFAAKDMPADQCSTGEQKALLIGIVLAHARLIAAERGAPPVLLLDEIAAHLDENRRSALFDLLASLGGQAWMTGTDSALFSGVRGNGLFAHVESAQISPEKRHLAA